IEPKLVRFRLAVHISIEVKDNASGDGLILPLFHEIFQFALILSSENTRDSDSQPAPAGLPDDALDSFICLRTAQAIVTLFRAVDRNLEMHMGPIGDLDGAVSNHHVMSEILRAHLDYFFPH